MVEFASLCFGIHPLKRFEGKSVKLRDIFRFRKHEVLREGRYAETLARSRRLILAEIALPVVLNLSFGLGLFKPRFVVCRGIGCLPCFLQSTYSHGISVTAVTLIPSVINSGMHGKQPSFRPASVR